MLDGDSTPVNGGMIKGTNSTYEGMRGSVGDLEALINSASRVRQIAACADHHAVRRPTDLIPLAAADKPGPCRVPAHCKSRPRTRTRLSTKYIAQPSDLASPYQAFSALEIDVLFTTREFFQHTKSIPAHKQEKKIQLK